MSPLRRLIDFYRLQFELLWTWRLGPLKLVRRLLVTFVVGFVSLGVTVWLVPGIRAPDVLTVALAVVAMALLNALIRPVILGLLAGISAIAVVVATLVFQVAIFFFVSFFVREFQVGGIGSAILASFAYGAVNWVLVAVFSIDSDQSYYGALVQRMAARRQGVIRTDAPGVVIVQIDGLAQPILSGQIRAGRVPVMSRWVRSHQMRLDRWTALLPSQTSASQAGILHGDNSFIPAFRWWEKRRGRMLVSSRPADAAEIVRRASNGEGLLSNDGASIGNLVSGDAARSYITMATISDRSHGLGTSQAFLAFFASPYGYLHTISRSIGEVLKELIQAHRAQRAGIDPSMHRGMPYPVLRAATNVAIRDLSTTLVIEEMYRGTPVIYVDYTDYDEIAHHSGPERSETLDALDGVDRVLGALERAARDAPRPYRFIVLSDHGQSLGATFRQRYGKTLEKVVAELMGGDVTVEAATGRDEEWGPVNAALSEATQTGRATGRLTRAALRRRTVEDGVVDVAPRAGPARPARAPGELPELVVCASGNLAHIYFPRLPGRLTLETIETTWPGLVASLARHPGVGALMVRSERHGAIVFGAEGARYLDEDRVTDGDPTAKFGRHAVASLRRLDGMEHTGDLVAISLVDPETDEVAAFEELIGSHGGLGGPQTQPFILHPADWPIHGELIGAEAVYRQIRRWLEATGIALGPAAKATTAARKPAKAAVAADPPAT